MVVKRAVEREGLERANRAVARLLRELALLARPGVTTKMLDEHARAFIARLGGQPVFFTEKGFPGAINTSVNNVVLHGVPDNTHLRAGDLLSIDAGMRLNGYCGDSCITVPIGTVEPRAERLLTVARGSMEAGLAAARTGNRVGDVSHAMQRYAEAHGCNVMRDFCGHGVGRKMHEAPTVPFAGTAGTGPRLVEGLVITVEPVVVEGSFDWSIAPDGWSVRTTDGGWGAQFEHTVIVGRQGPRILSAA